MHYADVDLGLASLGTNGRVNFFVMDLPAVRLNVHALNMILSRHCCLCLHFDDVFPLKAAIGLTNALLAGLSSPAKTSFSMHDGRYIRVHHSWHSY